jgi:transposase
MAKNSTLAAGIDTGKKVLDVALSRGEDRLRVDNTPSGWDELAGWLKRHRVRRVGIEASGAYEQGVVAALRQKKFIVIVFQPMQVRGYAIFTLKRAKNDRIDARLIALCAEAQTEIKAPPAQCFQGFCEHLTLIEQIEEDIARMKTRLEAFRNERLREQLVADIKRLKAWRRVELKLLRAAIEREDGLGPKLALIESVPGIAERTAIALLVRMPEIGTLSREQAAALAGLAPYDDDSATYTGVRHIAGGRGRLRKSLYAAALPAAFQWNPNLVALYQRLIAKNKSHKSALIACARKLLIYANTVVARGTPWLEARASN